MRGVATIMLSVLLAACGSDNTVGDLHDAVQFDVDGIALAYDKDMKLDAAAIPAEGIEFGLVGKEEYKALTFISSVKVDGAESNTPGIAGPSNPPSEDSELPMVFRGAWGEFKYVTNTAPYVTEVKISPNDAGYTRVITIGLSYGYWTNSFCLVQPPMEAPSE